MAQNVTLNKEGIVIYPQTTKEQIIGLADALGLKANLAAPALTANGALVPTTVDVLLKGTPSADSPALTPLHSNQIATAKYVQDSINQLVGGANGALDTLKEISDWLTGTDAGSLTELLSGKVSKTGDTMTGSLGINGGTNYLQVDSGLIKTSGGDIGHELRMGITGKNYWEFSEYGQDFRFCFGAKDDDIKHTEVTRLLNGNIFTGGEIYVKTPVTDAVNGKIYLNTDTTKSKKVWHSGDTTITATNFDGLATDSWKLGGRTSGGFVKNNNIVSTDTENCDANSLEWNVLQHDYRWDNIPENEIGSVFNMTYSEDWISQLFAKHSKGSPLYIRSRYSGTTWGDWFSIYHSGNSNLDTVDWTAKHLLSKRMAISSSDGVGDGISLHQGHDYGITGSTVNGVTGKLPSYGISFAKSEYFGNHGGSKAGWNTYFTTTSFGWVFKTNAGNVASIDNSGKVTATEFIGALTGNATTATKLAKAVTIFGQSFDGSGNIEGNLYCSDVKTNYVSVSSLDTGGFAKGMFAKTSDGKTTKAGIGFYGDSGVWQSIYLGFGDNPWGSATSLHITPTDLTFLNKTVYHAGNSNKNDVDWTTGNLTATGKIKINTSATDCVELTKERFYTNVLIKESTNDANIGAGALKLTFNSSNKNLRNRLEITDAGGSLLTLNNAGLIETKGFKITGSSDANVLLAGGGSTALADLQNPYEANLKWGGKNFAGSFGPLDAALIPRLGANRFAFIPAKGITVEYSRDSGATWIDYGADDNSKLGLTSGYEGGAYYIGKYYEGDLKDDGNMGLRITIGPNSQCGLYTTLNKFCIFINTDGSNGTRCVVESSLNKSSNTFEVVSDTSLNGRSGFNIINTKDITFGGNQDQTGYIRFTFSTTGGANDVYKGLIVYNIYGFGGVGWVTPSNMARHGHIYDFDGLQNATFPAGIAATKTITATGGFIGSLTGNASTATKLAAPITIWGQSFDGSTNIGGDIICRGVYCSDNTYYNLNKTGDTYRALVMQTAENSTVASIGFRGSNNAMSAIYLGVASNAATSANSLYITADAISFKGNAIYHAGNKNIGTGATNFAAGNHTHSQYLNLAGGTLATAATLSWQDRCSITATSGGINIKALTSNPNITFTKTDGSASTELTFDGSKTTLNSALTTSNLWEVHSYEFSKQIMSDWTDTGITLKMDDASGLFIDGPGSYMISVYVGQYSDRDAHGMRFALFAGALAFGLDDTNSSDSCEIIMHNQAHAVNGKTMYLRTINHKSVDTTYPAKATLELACSEAWSKAAKITIKTKRIM